MPPGDEESMPSTTAFDTTQSSSERPVRFRVDPRYSKIYAKQPLQRPRSSSFVSPAHEPVGVSRNFRFKFQFFLDQTFAVLVSSFFLILVVCWATLLRIASALPRFLRPTKKTAAFPWDTYDFKNEKVTKEVAYYARQVGFDIVDETAETEDGFYLKIHRVVNPRHKPRPDGRGGYPVLLLHGLFQCSGCFITSEERSLAFWLSEHGGYQVFLGNTRGLFEMGHKEFSRSDPRFWDWTIREQAMYDFPAMVEWVCAATGYDQIAFLGHSQGNGTAFISLSEGFRPDIGKRLSCFIAAAPAVYAGPLTTGFPFNTLSRMEWKTWRRIFGVLDFIPLMRWSYDHVPSKIFTSMGYIMFAFLFNWTDTNWLHRRKMKMFRFTPIPVSSAAIFWWCGKGGFAQRECILDIDAPRWFEPESFPPLSIYHGGQDFLVLTEPFLQRLRVEEEGIDVIRIEKLELSEHCDFYWAADAVEWCFSSFLEDIERTRPLYPEEQESLQENGGGDILV